MTDYIDRNIPRYLPNNNNLNVLANYLDNSIVDTLLSKSLFSSVKKVRIFKFLHDKYCKDRNFCNNEVVIKNLYHLYYYEYFAKSDPFLNCFKLEGNLKHSFGFFKLLHNLGFDFTQIRTKWEDAEWQTGQEFNEEHRLFLQQIDEFLAHNVMDPLKKDYPLTKAYSNYVFLVTFTNSLMDPFEQAFKESNQYSSILEQKFERLVQYLANNTGLEKNIVKQILTEYLTLDEIAAIYPLSKLGIIETAPSENEKAVEGLSSIDLLKAEVAKEMYFPEKERKSIEAAPSAPSENGKAVEEFNHYNYVKGSLLGTSVSMICEIVDDYTFGVPRDNTEYIHDYVDRLSWNVGSIFANYASAFVINMFYPAQGNKGFAVSQPIINTLLVLAHGLYNEGKVMFNIASIAVNSFVILNPSVLIEYSGTVGFAGSVFEKGSCAKLAQNSGEYIYHNGHDVYEALVGQLNELLI